MTERFEFRTTPSQAACAVCRLPYRLLWGILRSYLWPGVGNVKSESLGILQNGGVVVAEAAVFLRAIA